MTLHLSKFCSEHQINLIALHPNATYISQPLDVSLFRTLKANWQRVVQEFSQETLCIGVHKYQFAPLLQKTFKSMLLTTTLKNGFKKCDSFNFNDIDYTKIVNKKSVQDESSDDAIKNEMIATESDPLKALENFLQDKLQDFQFNTSPTWKGETKYEGLFEMWYNLANPSNNAINHASASVNEQVNNYKLLLLLSV